MRRRSLSRPRSGAPPALAASVSPNATGETVDTPSLFSLVAHELRAPLNALVVGAELLVEHLESPDPAQVRDTVSVIRRGSLMMQELVENVLSAASIDAGRFHLQRRPIRLLDILAEVEPIVGPILHQREQPLRVTVRGDVTRIAADSRRIGQVLVNLISNASKFGPVGQPIDLQIRGKADVVRVTVADRGPGLPPGRHARLFEPFQRGYPAPRSGYEGLGLGLAIVRAVVRAHEGRVGARNRRGGGAAVWFELPRQAVER